MASQNLKQSYSDVVIPFIPRLLSLIDRNENSPTYGCADRSFWLYKIIAFPCARFQESALTLALVHNKKFPNNIYYKSKKIRDLTKGTALFWSEIQKSNGSFDEAYPNENSFVATAFSCYAISEVYKLFEDEFTDTEKEQLINGLKKAANWLLRNDNLLVINQEAGACAALFNVYLVTNDEKYEKGADCKLEKVFENQSEEGWFYEYGGPDFGYLSLAIDYLAKYFRISNDKRVLEPLNRAVSFFSYFIHPNGTVGGEYGSRNTEYILPHGFEILAEEIPMARSIADKFIESLSKNDVIAPHLIDDRYFQYHQYSFLQAYEDFTPRSENKIPLPFERQFKMFFPHSKLYVSRLPQYYIVINANKAGVIKVYTVNAQPKCIFDDSGFFLICSNGKRLANQRLDPSFIVDYSSENECIGISGQFHEEKYSKPSTLSMLLLRTVLLTIGRSERISRLIKNKIREELILTKVLFPLEFEKKVFVKDDQILIEDILKMTSNVEIHDLKIGSKVSTIHVSSSKYFQKQELDIIENELPNSVVDLFNSRKYLKILRKINPLTQEIKINIS
jgi:hypothetical protein